MFGVVKAFWTQMSFTISKTKQNKQTKSTNPIINVLAEWLFALFPTFDRTFRTHCLLILGTAQLFRLSTLHSNATPTTISIQFPHLWMCVYVCVCLCVCVCVCVEYKIQNTLYIYMPSFRNVVHFHYFKSQTDLLTLYSLYSYTETLLKLH